MRGIVVDLFAGGGGASVGLEAALGRKVDVAVNHDATAIAVHTANHPRTRHFTEDVWTVDPVKATGGRPVDLLWASPDCTHFSIARGGKPNRSKKIRSLAWAVVRWAKAVRPKVILLENVREFQTWGPLDGEGRIIPHLKGRTFKAWAGNLRGLGYAVDWRILNAADYGAPTNRRRLFLVARCDGKPIAWPERTHGPGGALPYRTAAECIDWSIPCPSIFERKKPLAAKTLWRIANGIKRFVLDNPRPFIVKVNHGKVEPRAEELGRPLSTVTATQRGHAVVAPSLLKMRGDQVGAPVEVPLPTVTAGGHPKRPSTGQNLGIVAPLLAVTGYGEGPKQGPRVESLEQPAPTVVSSGIHRGLVAPVLARAMGESTAAPADAPAPTVMPSAQGKSALVSAFIAKHFGGHPTPGSQLPLPLDTVTTQDHNHLAAAYLAKFRGHPDTHPQGQPLEEPAPTLVAGGTHVAEVRAFLLKYYGNEKDGCDLLDPADTITTKDRLGLVTVEGVEYQIVDIGMRMLEPHELLRAQFGEFAEGYDLSAARTKCGKVRLIGNSVCPEVVRALAAVNTAPAKKRRRAA